MCATPDPDKLFEDMMTQMPFGSPVLSKLFSANAVPYLGSAAEISEKLHKIRQELIAMNKYRKVFPNFELENMAAARVIKYPQPVIMSTSECHKVFANSNMAGGTKSCISCGASNLHSYDNHDCGH